MVWDWLLLILIVLEFDSALGSYGIMMGDDILGLVARGFASMIGLV